MRSFLFDNRSTFADMDALFRDFTSARAAAREFDAVFRGLDGLHGLRQLGGSGVMSGPTATADGWELTADLPGVAPEDLHLDVEGRTLQIRAERKVAQGEGSVHSERRGWTLAKRMVLPDEVDAEAVGATLADGVLTVRLPRRPETTPRRIPVQG